MPFGGIVEIGVRSLSSVERDFLAGNGGVEVFPEWSEAAGRAIDGLPPKVYLSLDFDAVDPSLIRAVGTPEPGGLSWADLMGIFDHIFSGKQVVAMDAVELCPSDADTVSSFTAAKAVYEAISRHLALKGKR
jgi:agmatinase